MLNSDQEKAKTKIKAWWYSDHQAFILGGRAGTGKSFLCDSILNELPAIKPLICAPTHEALKQIKDKISFPNAIFKTAHSSLGLAPIDTEKDIKFEETKLPAIWEEVNLCIADEGSMYDDSIVKLLLLTGTKILFVGHRSQLPPVRTNRKTFDLCESPIFKYDFPSFDLTIPQRNTGELWDFCNLLEEHIYDSINRPIPLTFDITKTELKAKVSGELKEKIFNGDCKFVLWSNDMVNRYNNKFRLTYFGPEAKDKKYLPGDKIILTAPYTNIEFLEKHSDRSLLKLLAAKDEIPYFYSNSKAIVKSCEEKMVKLNQQLHIPVYKIFVNCEGEECFFYEPVYSEDHNRIAQYYEHLAWGFKDQQRKKRAYRERNFIRSMFAHVKHFYAATAHRLQGSTIEDIILINSDIERNSCRIERLKCRYVAASRARDNLYFYRGL